LGTRELIALESVGNGADHRTGTLSVKLKKGNSDTTLTEYMQINAVSNYLTFTPSGNERMRINNNTTTLTTNSAEYYATGMQINSQNADFSGALLDMRVTSGAINSVNGRFLRFYGGNGTGERFHVKGSGEIYTAAGIKFDDAGSSGTSTSNTLDSYEEGTFTPTLEDPDSGNAVSGYYYRTGRYTKIGSVVHISITLSPSNMGTLTNSTDNVHITGLPFASRGSIPNDTQVLPISSFNTGSYSYVVARLAQNTTQLEIRNIYASGGGWNYVKGNEMGAGSQQIVTATYLTDA